MKPKGQDIIYCPNCGENKVQSQKGFSVLMGIMLMGVGVWIPIIGWFILIPAGILLIIVSAVMGAIGHSVRFRCQACKHSFKVSKDIYKQYKNALK